MRQNLNWNFRVLLLEWALASATMPGAMQLNVGGTEYGVGYEHSCFHRAGA